MTDYRLPQWYSMGCRQMLFLVDHGLLPSHYLLDVGCGALRAGIHFLRYLKPGRYVGLEKEDSLVELAGEVLAVYGLTCSPILQQRSDFDLTGLGVTRFDYMLAQSVFTHLPPPDVEICLQRLMPCLAGGGSFFASFKRGHRIKIGKPHPTRGGEITIVSYPLSFFADLAGAVGCQVEDLGDWGHPGGLEMLRFYHPHD